VLCQQKIAKKLGDFVYFLILKSLLSIGTSTLGDFTTTIFIKAPYIQIVISLLIYEE